MRAGAVLTWNKAYRNNERDGIRAAWNEFGAQHVNWVVGRLTGLEHGPFETHDRRGVVIENISFLQRHGSRFADAGKSGNSTPVIFGMS